MEIWHLLITDKFLFWTFREWEIRSFFRDKKLMKRWYLLITEMFLFWTFQRRKIRSFFWGKKLMERWYLPINEKFLFWAFPWWKMQPFLETKSYWKDDIYWLLKVLVLNFSVMGIRSFFQPKSWCKGNICLVFLSFPWYSRTWEMRFFVQCINWSWIKNLINIWIW